jgi:hypothetical protein
LGLSRILFQYWVDPFNQPYQSYDFNYIIFIRSDETIFLKTPNVLQWAQTFFNDPSVYGVPFENNLNGTHLFWERHALMYDIMTAN